MNGIWRGRQAAFAVLLLAGLCTSSCRSYLDVAYDECLGRKQPACAVALASLELERRPACCECMARLALAKKQDALARMQTLSPSGLADALRQVAADYDGAAECGRGHRNRMYADAARDAMQLYRDIVADQDPAQWIAVTAIEDRDRRIDAVVAHATFHGSRCLHDVQGEYRTYLSAMVAAPTFEIRRRLPAMAATPLAGDLFGVYLSRRVGEVAHGPDRELEVLEQLRRELHGTLYAGMAEASLSAKAAATEDPFQVDRICRSLDPGPNRDACRSRAQTLWAVAIGGAPVRQLNDICPRIDAPEVRAQCQNALAEEALKLVTEDASAQDLELAEAAARQADAAYQREWRIRLLRRDADRNFSRIVDHQPESRVELTESVGAWQQFVDVFDTLTRKVSDNRHESLRSIHPQLVRQIEQRRRNKARQADDLFRKRARQCRAEHTKLTRNDKSVQPERVRRCVADLAAILTMDETHDRAKKLLNDLEDASSRLTIDQHTEWTTVVVPLLLTEALHNFVSPTFARLFIRTMRAVDF